MLRMEIALVLVLGFVAYMYDSAERTRDGAAPDVLRAAGGDAGASGV